MQDYEPLGLSALCNAGPETVAPRKPAIGLQSLRGLPFQIGMTEGSPCFLVFGSEAPDRSDSLRIPVGQKARRLLFAHVLLDSRLHEGDPPGREAAQYAFVFADQETIVVPIRERFEIAMNPTGWGELPFLAVPDRPDSLPERYEGRWGGWGIVRRPPARHLPQITSSGTGRIHDRIRCWIILKFDLLPLQTMRNHFGS